MKCIDIELFIVLMVYHIEIYSQAIKKILKIQFWENSSSWRKCVSYIELKNLQFIKSLYLRFENSYQ